MYTQTNKTVKSQCFPLLLWTEVQPVHTPVRTQAYGPALSQSKFSILSVFCLVYNNVEYLPALKVPTSIRGNKQDLYHFKQEQISSFSVYLESEFSPTPFFQAVSFSISGNRLGANLL